MTTTDKVIKAVLEYVRHSSWSKHNTLRVTPTHYAYNLKSGQHLVGVYVETLWLEQVFSVQELDDNTVDIDHIMEGWPVIEGTRELCRSCDTGLLDRSLPGAKICKSCGSRFLSGDTKPLQVMAS
ncbi:MAG TPA: hypothetical protein VH186_05790 [Chloroflexia bacterium]|nr:hypothetical protein [Chloroflexia bacterium]